MITLAVAGVSTILLTESLMEGSTPMLRFVKFLHVLGAIGFMGAIASILILIGMVPTASPDARALMSRAMGQIATWLLFPSLVLTLMSGLLSMAINRAYHNAGWAWAKMISGVLIFEGGMADFLGPLQDDARRSAGTALGGHPDPAGSLAPLGALQGTGWFLLVIAVANIVLGIWRPRFTRLPD